MERIRDQLPLVAYAGGGLLLANYGSSVWGVDSLAAAAAGWATAAAFTLAHLLIRSNRRARRVLAQGDAIAALTARVEALQAQQAEARAALREMADMLARRETVERLRQIAERVRSAPIAQAA